MSVTRLQVADVDLELFDSGKGSPLLFLHGAGGFARAQPFVAPLAAKHRLIAPSHPGFGTSEPAGLARPPSTTSRTFISSCSIARPRQVDMIGCSIGGWIAAEMATKAPERFERLVMVGPVGVKVGPADKLDIPDIFAMPQADVEKLLYHDPARMAPDTIEDDRRATGRHVPQPRNVGAAGVGAVDAQSQAQAPAAPRRMPGAVHPRRERRPCLRRLHASLREVLLPNARTHDHPGRRPRAASSSSPRHSSRPSSNSSEMT